MEKKRTIAQESLYFLMYAEDVKILISSTHYIPFDQKYLNLPPKESRNISPQTYYKELEKEIKKIEAQESSIKPVKKLGTWPKLK